LSNHWICHFWLTLEMKVAGTLWDQGGVPAFIYLDPKVVCLPNYTGPVKVIDLDAASKWRKNMKFFSKKIKETSRRSAGGVCLWFACLCTISKIYYWSRIFSGKSFGTSSGYSQSEPPFSRADSSCPKDRLWSQRLWGGLKHWPNWSPAILPCGSGSKQRALLGLFWPWPMEKHWVRSGKLVFWVWQEIRIDRTSGNPGIFLLRLQPTEAHF